MSRLDGGTDHGHVVGVRLGVSLFIPGCPCSWPCAFCPARSFTHIASVSLPVLQEQNTQSDRTNISFHGHRGHPPRTRDVSHLSWTCSRRLLSRGAWVYVHHIHRSSSVRLLSSSWVSSSASVLPRVLSHLGSARLRVSLALSCHTLGCSSESVPASTDQQLIHPTCPMTAQPVTDDTLASFLPPTTSLIHPNLPMCLHS